MYDELSTNLSIDNKFCLLEKQQQPNFIFDMEMRVYPLFTASMTWESLL